MQPPFFSFREFLTQLVADMAGAVSIRDGEPVAQRQVRTQLAARMILEFLPRDVIEAILAGRCVMFHELTIDGVRRTLIGEADPQRRATRANIVALDRCFANNLKLLEHYKTRPSDGERDAHGNITQDSDEDSDQDSDQDADPATGAADDTETRAAEHQTVAAPDPTQACPPIPRPTTEPDLPRASAAGPRRSKIYDPSDPMVAAVLTNPEAMAAIASGDAAAFARALGVEPPDEFLAAAAEPGSPFDRSAWRAGSAGTQRDEDPDLAAQRAPERILEPAGD